MENRNENRYYIISSDIRNYRGQENKLEQEEWQQTLRESIGSAAAKIGLEFDYGTEKNSGNLQVQGDSLTWRVVGQQVDGSRLVTEFLADLSEQLKEYNSTSGRRALEVRVGIDYTVTEEGSNGWLGTVHRVVDMRDCRRLRDSQGLAPVVAAVSGAVYEVVRHNTEKKALFQEISYRSKSGKTDTAWMYVPGVLPKDLSRPKRSLVYGGVIFGLAVLAGAVWWLVSAPEEQWVESLRVPPFVALTDQQGYARPTFEASRAGRYLTLTVSLSNPQGGVNDCMHQSELSVSSSPGSPEIPLVPGTSTTIDLGSPTKIANPTIRLTGAGTNCNLLLTYEGAAISNSISLLKG